MPPAKHFKHYMGNFQIEAHPMSVSWAAFHLFQKGNVLELKYSVTSDEQISVPLCNSFFLPNDNNIFPAKKFKRYMEMFKSKHTLWMYPDQRSIFFQGGDNLEFKNIVTSDEKLVFTPMSLSIKII